MGKLTKDRAAPSANPLKKKPSVRKKKRQAECCPKLVAAAQLKQSKKKKPVLDAFDFNIDDIDPTPATEALFEDIRTGMIANRKYHEILVYPMTQECPDRDLRVHVVSSIISTCAVFGHRMNTLFRAVYLIDWLSTMRPSIAYGSCAISAAIAIATRVSSEPELYTMDNMPLGKRDVILGIEGFIVDRCDVIVPTIASFLIEYDLDPEHSKRAFRVARTAIMSYTLAAQCMPSTIAAAIAYITKDPKSTPWDMYAKTTYLEEELEAEMQAVRNRVECG